MTPASKTREANIKRRRHCAQRETCEGAADSTPTEAHRLVVAHFARARRLRIIAERVALRSVPRVWN